MPRVSMTYKSVSTKKGSGFGTSASVRRLEKHENSGARKTANAPRTRQERPHGLTAYVQARKGAEQHNSRVEV